tara:strand:+ start:238 stop:816 length:579 start_codon:yes stop_codon:yes gene_type:complete
MKKIGLTGGIGSGKTTVSKIFKLIGIPVYNSDEVAKKILKKNNLVQKKIIEIFGEKILTKNKIDNTKLANIIFSNKKKLETINNIIHPLVKKDFQLWCKQKKNKYIIKESALIFTSNAYKDLDQIIFVKSPLELRIKRIKERDKKSLKETLAIIENQPSEELFKKKCDYIIHNNEQIFLTPQVLQLNTIFIK